MSLRSKKLFVIIPFITLLLIIVVIFKNKQYNNGNKPSSISKVSKQINQKNIAMQITSSTFQDNQNIPSKYTCNGDNINPPLQFANVPQNTKSLVLIVDDPDAPMGTWIHWVLYNIDPHTKEIAENSVPQGAMQGMTSFGKPGYGGPCPPSGTHHYHFKLYALDTILEGLNNPDKTTIEQAMNGHIIGQTEVIGLYSKK